MDEIEVYLISGGRESTAMAIKKIKQFGLEYFDHYDDPNAKRVMLFADTGDDPLGVETNWFLKKYHNWPIKTVYSEYGKIMEYYENKIVDDQPEYTGHAMPSQANKDCSLKFKIIPECKWIVEKFGTDVSFKLFFGFSDSKKEKARAEALKKRLAKKKKIRQTPVFPLIESQLDRDDCGKICQEYMGFIPERSQCRMCFERTIDDWKHFNKIMPRATQELVIPFEESSKLFKKFGYGLSSKPIRKILRIPDKHQTVLDIKPCPCVEDFDLECVINE